MIITCPHCNARYKVQDGLITERGKKVKCKKCTSVFIAYPDKPSVLQRPPEKQADKPAKPEAPSAPSSAAPSGAAPSSAAPSSAAPSDQAASKKAASQTDAGTASANTDGQPGPQATVKVDRSMLNNFIQDATNKAQPRSPQSSATHGAEADKLQQYMDENREPDSGDVDVSGGATVQVDRTKIDAFMKDQNQPVDEAALRTMQVDRDQLDQALTQDGREEENPAHATMQVDRDKLDQALNQGQGHNQPPTHATVQVDRAELDNALQQGGPAPSADPTLGNEDSDFDVDLPEAPDFSGFDDDDDFGEVPAFGEDDFSDRAPDVAADLPAFQSGEDVPSFSDLNQQPPVPTEPGPISPSDSATVLFKAQIDGRIYPDLDLATIGQWIKEERLLETDMIAPMDSADFKQADTYPQFAKFFIEYYGQANQEQTQQSTEQTDADKKGLISRLFGRKK